MAKLKTVRKLGENGLSMALLRREFANLRKASVKAGVLGDGEHSGDGLTNAQLASIHEYGLGTVLARPFIGPPFRQHRAEYFKILSDAYKRALKAGKPKDVERVLALLGQKMAADIKMYVKNGVAPPNTDETIARKGSSKPLVDTGEMLNSVTYKVMGTGEGE